MASLHRQQPNDQNQQNGTPHGDLPTGVINGFIAYVRWRNNDVNQLPPDARASRIGNPLARRYTVHEGVPREDPES